MTQDQVLDYKSSVSLVVVFLYDIGQFSAVLFNVKEADCECVSLGTNQFTGVVKVLYVTLHCESVCVCTCVYEQASCSTFKPCVGKWLHVIDCKALCLSYSILL